MAHIIIYSPDMKKIIKDINVSINSPIKSNEVDEQGNVITVTEGHPVIDFTISFGNGYLELVTKEIIHIDFSPEKIVNKRIWGNMPYFISYEGEKE